MKCVALTMSDAPPAIEGRVARISIEGIFDRDMLKKSLGEDQLGSANQSYELVPGPNSPLRIGYDDVEIHRFCFDNMVELSGEKNRQDRYYIVLISTVINGLTLNKGVVHEVEYRPLNLIIADSMEQAIELFEKENGKRRWLPAEGIELAHEKQIGISRMTSDQDVRGIRIERVRKDCVLKKSGKRT